MKTTLRKDREALFEELAIEFLSKKYGVSLSEILKSEINTGSDASGYSFPIRILTQELSSLEAIVKYLRENKKLSYGHIGKLLSRNPRTLAVTYSVARRKHPEIFSAALEKDITVPFTIFNMELSILESIATYLHNSGNTYSEIGRMLNKDSRTIWTVCKRAEIKLK